MIRKAKSEAILIQRQNVVLGIMISVCAVIALKVVLLDNEGLQAKGDRQYLREIEVPPNRGRIIDRNGEILSASTPVQALAANPREFCPNWRDQKNLPAMLDEIGVSEQALSGKCDGLSGANFMYVKRGLPPEIAERVMAMEIPGLRSIIEQKRFYPGGPVSAHLLGFTDIDDRGQEGLERVYDSLLTGEAGSYLVLQGPGGLNVEIVGSVKPVQHGEDLQISIDQRVQSMASRHLESAVLEHRASGGSVVVLAVPSGEILAMVNSPRFNANNRSTLKGNVFRNRAVTDVFEPGSTAKPFTIAMVLEHGEVDEETLIDTGTGTLDVGGYTIQDTHNHGMMSVSDILVRSSNVGAAKLALGRPFEELFDTLERVGFGEKALGESGEGRGRLPGEVSGLLAQRTETSEHATMSYGYGFSSTLLQLARAYTVFATDGELLPVTLMPRQPGYRAQGTRVFQADTVHRVRAMLERVATSEGTARKAAIARYRAGGKTGTTRKLVNGQYSQEHYLSLFAGLAPVTDPRFVMVVVIDDPQAGHYYGGSVAAPVFSSLMSDLMRLYNIEPDGLDRPRITSTSEAGNNV
ncbi:MAG: penicillin-binding protein 2 [Gammaproteobacteria bacterium]|nr:penicillin-binding protein 2 [Gammaproteobacteria bacterium]